MRTGKLLSEKEAHALLLRKIADAGGVTPWSRLNGVSLTYGYELARGGRPITAAIASKIGLEACEQMYRRKGTA
jgi:hypothetical protein